MQNVNLFSHPCKHKANCKTLSFSWYCKRNSTQIIHCRERSSGQVVLNREKKSKLWSSLSRPQIPSLLRMTEREKSSGELWNTRLSYWFSRKTKNTHLIGSFYFARKWKVCLVLLSAGAVDYKYARKEKLFGAILVINFSGIKRHLTNEKPVTCRSLLVEPLAHSFFWETTASIIDFCPVFNLKLLSLPALVKAKSNVLLNNEAIF